MGPSRLCLEVWILFRVQQEALGGSEQSSGYLIYLLNPNGFCMNGGGQEGGKNGCRETNQKAIIGDFQMRNDGGSD